MSKPPKGTQPPVDAEGKQNVLGKRLTPEQGFEELQKAKRFGRLPCWPHLVPKLKPIDSKQPSKGNLAVLECSQCEADLRPSNISGIPSYIQTYPLLARAARRLLAMHTTSCFAERNWSAWGNVYTKGRNRLGLTLGEMIVYLRCNGKGAAGGDEEVMLRELYEMEVAAEAEEQEGEVEIVE